MYSNFLYFFRHLFWLIFVCNSLNYTNRKIIPKSFFIQTPESHQQFKKALTHIKANKQKDLAKALQRKKRQVAAEQKTKTWKYKTKEFFSQVYGFLDNFFNHTMPGKITKNVLKKLIIAGIIIGLSLYFLLKKTNPLKDLYTINEKITDDKDAKKITMAKALNESIDKEFKTIQMPQKVQLYKMMLMIPMPNNPLSQPSTSANVMDEKIRGKIFLNLSKILDGSSIDVKDKNVFFSPLRSKNIANYKNTVNSFVQNTNLSIFEPIIYSLLLKKVMIITLDDYNQYIKFLDRQYESPLDKINNRISAKRYIGNPYQYYRNQLHGYEKLENFDENIDSPENFHKFKRHMLFKIDDSIKKQIQIYLDFIKSNYQKEYDGLFNKVKSENPEKGTQPTMINEFLEYFLEQISCYLLVSTFEKNYD